MSGEFAVYLVYVTLVAYNCVLVKSGLVCYNDSAACLNCFDILKILEYDLKCASVCALVCCLTIGAPVVFARKRKSLTLTDNLYSSKVHSFTKNETNEISVSKNFLSAEDNVIIIDDFLANGEAVKGLLDIANQAGATVVGVGIVIEKGFQDGGKLLRENGVRIESLARIKSLANGKVEFFEDGEF